MSAFEVASQTRASAAWPSSFASSAKALAASNARTAASARPRSDSSRPSRTRTAAASRDARRRASAPASSRSIAFGCRVTSSSGKRIGARGMCGDVERARRDRLAIEHVAASVQAP